MLFLAFLFLTLESRRLKRLSKSLLLLTLLSSPKGAPQLPFYIGNFILTYAETMLIETEEGKLVAGLRLLKSCSLKDEG